MIIRGIKINNKKPTESQLTKIINKLQKTFDKVGFDTNVYKRNSSSITLSLGGKCFAVNVSKLGYNYRVNRCTVISCKSFYKRTSSPTWNQRVQFNNVLNDVLDSLKVTAFVRANGGNVGNNFQTVIREYDGRISYWEEPYPYDKGYGLQISSLIQIQKTEEEAKEKLVEWGFKTEEELHAIGFTKKFKALAK